MANFRALLEGPEMAALGLVVEADIDGPHEPPPRRARAGNGNDCGGDVAVNPIGRVSAI
jgi:hypothetical protein